MCGGRLLDGTPCGRKLDQGPPWRYEITPDGLEVRFRCDRCGADHSLSKQDGLPAFNAAWTEALRKPGPERVIRLPLAP